MEIEGQCHCGRIRFRAIIDPDVVTVCHCTDCQQLTGTAFRVSVTVRREALTIEGAPTVYEKHGDSGRRRYQLFCGACGSPLFTHGEGADADVWGVRWGAIHQRAAFAPTRQIWRRSAPAWTCAFAGAPACETE